MVRVPPMAPKNKSYLYAIQCHDFFKVGISADVGRRMADLQIGNPYLLELAMYRSLAPDQVFLVERDMHEMLKDWEIGREWFKAPLSTIQEAVKIAILNLARRRTAMIAWQDQCATRQAARLARKAELKAPKLGVLVESLARDSPYGALNLKKINKIRLMRNLERRQKCL